MTLNFGKVLVNSYYLAHTNACKYIEIKMKPGKTGIARIVAAFGYSWKGLQAAYRHEAAFRQELLLTAIGIPLAFWLAESSLQLLLLILPLILLLLVELANSAIEAIVDRIGDEIHQLSGRAKDMGSAMVMLAIIMVILSWVLVLGENYVW